MSGERVEEKDQAEVRNSRASGEGMCRETRSEDCLTHWLHSMTKDDPMILETSTTAIERPPRTHFSHTPTFFSWPPGIPSL